MNLKWLLNLSNLDDHIVLDLVRGLFGFIFVYLFLVLRDLVWAIIIIFILNYRRLLTLMKDFRHTCVISLIWGRSSGNMLWFFEGWRVSSLLNLVLLMESNHRRSSFQPRVRFRASENIQLLIYRGLNFTRWRSRLIVDAWSKGCRRFILSCFDAQQECTKTFLFYRRRHFAFNGFINTSMFTDNFLLEITKIVHYSFLEILLLR